MTLIASFDAKPMLTKASSFSDDFTTDITIVGENTDLNTPIVGGAEETYQPMDRIWQGCPNIIVTQKRIWAAWYTGGPTEPHQRNYCVIAYSEDGGKTWVDPYMIIDPAVESESTVLPLFFLYENELWIIYFHYKTTNSGTYAIKSSNFDADDINDVTWSEPAYLFARMIHHRPTVLSDGSLVVGAQGSDKTITNVYKSTNKGITWFQSGTAASDLNSYHKAKIVQKKDGSLWMLSQLERGTGGGMQQSFSYDGGYTWTRYEYDLDPPLISPGARFEITRLISGNLALVSYATTNSRTDLTIYLSEDDGATWKHSILLDSRTEVSYPDLAQDEQGNIYVIWDMGRYEQKEIRMSIMTEQDIKNGKLAFEKEMIVISKLSDYKDIVGASGLDRTITVKKGTLSKDIIQNLPSPLTVIDEDGKAYQLNGRWVSKGYKADVEGKYVFTFLPEGLGLLQDVHNLLKVEIIVKAEKSGANVWLIVGIAAAVVVLAGAGLSALLIKRKKAKRD